MSKLSETPCHRSYFYVGGSYIDHSHGQHIFQGQMYVERLVPVGGPRRRLPLVFIHGAGQTATNWLNTPDGRKGWASFFLDHGFTVYLVDKTGRGRSSWLARDERQMILSAEFIESRFTATQDTFQWPQAKLHTQWPGSGRRGDPTFDAFLSCQVPFMEDFATQRESMREPGRRLLEMIGPAIVIAHSQGGPIAWIWADLCPHLVKAVVALEPSGPPFHDDGSSTSYNTGTGLSELTWRPPFDHDSMDTPLVRVVSCEEGLSSVLLQEEPVRSLVNLKDIPVLFLTAEASYHAPYDHCTVAFLRQAGVSVDHKTLAELDIHGNGHMFFLELNNLEIADVVQQWITSKFSDLEQ